MSDEQLNYEPQPNQRDWYSHTRTGDRGWLVRRDGVDYIKLDRPNEEILKRFQQGEWHRDEEHRPMTVAQVAQIAYEADRKLCFFIGQHDRARKEWPSLSDKERIAWMKEGPTDGGPREALYAHCFMAMREWFR